MGFTMANDPVSTVAQGGIWGAVPQNALANLLQYQAVQRGQTQNKYLPPELAAMVQQQQQKALQMQAQTPYSGPQAAANVGIAQSQIPVNQAEARNLNSQVPLNQAQTQNVNQNTNLMPHELWLKYMTNLIAQHPWKSLFGNIATSGNVTDPNSIAGNNAAFLKATNPTGSTPFGSTNGMISAGSQNQGGSPLVQNSPGQSQSLPQPSGIQPAPEKYGVIPNNKSNSGNNFDISKYPKGTVLYDKLGNKYVSDGKGMVKQ